MTATKTYNYTDTKKETKSTEMIYHYENLPIGLKNNTEYRYTNETISTQPQNRVIHVGTRTSKFIGNFEYFDIDFETEYINDNSIPTGNSIIKNPEAKGIRTVVYREIRDNNTNELISRELVSDNITIKPVITTVKRTVEESIPFTIRTINDNDLAVGIQLVATSGKPGSRMVVYEDTLDTQGNIISSKIISSIIITEPVEQIIRIGVKQPFSNTNKIDGDIIKQNIDTNLPPRKNAKVLYNTGEKVNNSISIIGILMLFVGAVLKMFSRKKKENNLLISLINNKIYKNTDLPKVRFLSLTLGRSVHPFWNCLFIKVFI